ncbi:hypothetical protein CVT24_005265 [Panaeolus cyanescens]|uniref:Ribonuclease H2 subunit B n=1 Tax=Panaeolus cyanescens TaxID=181874 RepID=A0A409Y921_9AGAR|nr:hypothetical protein CVT24_005265 [Panaeolus cyanescens]
MPPILSVLPTDVVQIVASTLANNMNDVPAAKSARLNILRLLHPRTGLPSLFLPTDSTTNPVLEIQSISPPDERSWIIDQEVIADGKLLVMTPIDPTFLLLPIIKASQSNETMTQFRTADDIFEVAAAQIAAQCSDDTIMPTKQDILEFSSLNCVKSSMASICDAKDITVYRFSKEKLQEFLKSRITRITASQAFKESKTVTRILARDGLMDDGKEELLNLGRIRAGCDLLSQYLSPEDKALMLQAYDFSELDQHIQWLHEIAVKNAATTAPAKKGKADAKGGDKKRKATKASHGVETLKKANVNGMAKISSFFNKTS